MFGGQAAVVKTAGGYVDDMIVKRSVGIKISLKPTSDRNRMGHLATIRKELDAARDAIAEDKQAEAKTTARRRSPTRRSRTTSRTRRPTTPRATRSRGRAAGSDKAAATRRRTPADAALVREALDQAAQGRRAGVHLLRTGDGRAAGDQAHQRLQAQGRAGARPGLPQGRQARSPRPSCRSSSTRRWSYWETDPRTGEERQIALPKIYRDAGVPVTFQVTGFAAGNLFRAPNLPPTVGHQLSVVPGGDGVKYGTPADEALNAITLRPAQALGVGASRARSNPAKTPTSRS